MQQTPQLQSGNQHQINFGVQPLIPAPLPPTGHPPVRSSAHTCARTHTHADQPTQPEVRVRKRELQAPPERRNEGGSMGESRGHLALQQSKSGRGDKFRTRAL
jgi:hypothetical protein